MVFLLERPRIAGQNALALNFLSKLGALLLEFSKLEFFAMGRSLN